MVLVVSDDGRGMDQRAAGAGWTTCGPARTARRDLRVESEAGSGTTVTWTVPLFAP